MRVSFFPGLGLVELLVWLSGDCQFSKGVISGIEPEEVARRHHLAELEKIESYSQKGGGGKIESGENESSRRWTELLSAYMTVFSEYRICEMKSGFRGRKSF